MAELLVSVRTPHEAEVAQAAGASIIDVKEPARGSLGRADDDTIAAVIAEVGGSRPVSAAMGELLEERCCFAEPGLSFLKWGLAGCHGSTSWQTKLRDRISQARQINPSCEAVVVAYADWRRASAPPPEEVCAFAT